MRRRVIKHRQTLQSIRRMALKVYHGNYEKYDDNAFARMSKFLSGVMERLGFRHYQIENDEGDLTEEIWVNEGDYALVLRYSTVAWKIFFMIDIITRREAEKRISKVNPVWVWPGS